MHQHQGGKWEFIGGKIDANESAKQALMREVNEEIGLSLNTDQLVLWEKCIMIIKIKRYIYILMKYI